MLEWGCGRCAHRARVVAKTPGIIENFWQSSGDGLAEGGSTVQVRTGRMSGALPIWQARMVSKLVGLRQGVGRQDSQSVLESYGFAECGCRRDRWHR